MVPRRKRGRERKREEQGSVSAKEKEKKTLEEERATIVSRLDNRKETKNSESLTARGEGGFPGVALVRGVDDAPAELLGGLGGGLRGRDLGRGVAAKDDARKRRRRCL